ncbi:metallophosphoesterase [Psychrobacillus sp. MER TA 171]|uniref:metallophosphoesterase family protein n=1 Tax=Psychrobacillus sp. MER TA 171 TaxID=2939577 RepID=UPI0020420B1D|nr:metallophosphoesterase [Psychrobacillus sp. MER TA 171]MCM3358101.1 metallophosphoesterase [Psychrobacillus sp. MER TA 171]
MELKILAFADTRTTIKLPDVEPDVVLLLGDIQSKTVSQINKKYKCNKLGVFGNHCHPKNFEDTEVVNMHCKIQIINGITFAGFEGAPTYKSDGVGQHTESECEMFIKELGDRHVDVFISHSNPSYGDMNLDDAHRGFKSYNPLLMGNQISHFFHGHLHDPFTRDINKSVVHSVYSYLWVTVNVNQSN